MLDAYRDLIDELLSTPSEIRGIVDAAGVSSVSPEATRVIVEMRDQDRAVLERAQTITRQDMPYLRARRPNEQDVTTTTADLPALLGEMEQARGDLVSLLINLSLKDWGRQAIDETEGEVTLADEIERHVEFDEAQRGRFRELTH
jgi:hypothetical protein